MKVHHTRGPWKVIGSEIRSESDLGVIVARIPSWGVAADEAELSDAAKQASEAIAKATQGGAA